MTLLEAWLEFSRHNAAFQQFGQGNDSSTFNGATGCTHTILQRLIKAKHGSAPTHNVISDVAGYPPPNQNPRRRGLNAAEVARVIRHYDVPYRVVAGQTFDDLKRHRDRGPIALAVMYGWWPEWEGFVYAGRKADGKPNGFCIEHGKTQLAGFTGRHMTLWLGSRTVVVGGKRRFRSYCNEPNHASPARPERPAYDVMRTRRLRHAYDSYADANGGARYAWIPTEHFRPKGY